MASSHLIYFLEDNSTENMLMKLALQKLPKIEPVFFSSGHQLLEEQKKRSANIIVTDLMVPGISGYEVIRNLHKQFPKTMIIVLSAQNEVDQIADLQGLGIFNYIVKGDHCLQYLKKTIEVACFLVDREFEF